RARAGATTGRVGLDNLSPRVRQPVASVRDNRASGKTGGSNTRHTRIYRTPVPIWVMLVGNHGTCDHEWLVTHRGISSSVVMSVPSSSLGLKGTATKRRRHGTYTQERPRPHRRRQAAGPRRRERPQRPQPRQGREQRRGG